MAGVILVDAGNTWIKLALARGGTILRRGRLPTASFGRPALRRALRCLVRGGEAEGAVFCSVVPRCDGVIVDELRRVSGRPPISVAHTLELGFKISYPRPGTLGADRLANACGAAWRYGTPVVVADFGTALTFDVVTRKRGYIGGVIAPGPGLFADYLAERTALLPRVELSGRPGKLGHNTRDAIRIGGLVGYRGLVRELTRHVLGGPGLSRVRLCATGGWAAGFVPGLGLRFAVDPDLTLSGLYRVWELNRDLTPGCPARCVEGKRAAR